MLFKNEVSCLIGNEFTIIDGIQMDSSSETQLSGFFFFWKGIPSSVSGLNGLKLTYWKRP